MYSSHPGGQDWNQKESCHFLFLLIILTLRKKRIQEIVNVQGLKREKSIQSDGDKTFFFYIINAITLSQFWTHIRLFDTWTSMLGTYKLGFCPSPRNLLTFFQCPVKILTRRKQNFTIKSADQYIWVPSSPILILL